MQLRTVANHAERLARDSSTYLDLWAPFANKDFARYKNEEAKLRASAGPFQAMRDYAEWAEKQATLFGEMFAPKRTKRTEPRYPLATFMRLFADCGQAL